MAEPCDIISNLPDDVTQILLMYLPTRDAIRTSILSRKWRYSWTKLPQLILDETLWKEFITTHSAKITFTTVLFQLVLLHKGPINKFTLSIPQFRSCPEIDSFIVFYIRNGIEDLTLDMPTSECYKLPSSFLKCQHLKHLSLKFCLINTTPDFKGFGKLITLKLCEVNISNEALGSLISNSPFLEVLELKNYSGSYDLEMDVPNLKTFYFGGRTKNISFIKAPLLSSFTISQCLGAHNKISPNVLDFCNCVPILEYLDLDFVFVRSLAIGGVPRRLETSLTFLKRIKLSGIKLHRLDELSIILCLMRNSPNLNCIDIKIHIDKYPLDRIAALENLKEEDKSDVMLNELKEVKLKNITGTIVELEFIKLILTKSLNLQKMIIEPGYGVNDKGSKILEEVNKFCRASQDAKVIFEHKLDVTGMEVLLLQE